MRITQLTLKQIVITAKIRHQGYLDVGLKHQAFETGPSAGEGSCNPFECCLTFHWGRGWWLFLFSSHIVKGGVVQRRMLKRGKTVFIRNLYHSPDGLVAGFKAFIRHHVLKGELKQRGRQGQRHKTIDPVGENNHFVRACNVVHFDTFLCHPMQN